MMKSDTVLKGLESLSKAGLTRTPAKFGEIAELWLHKFKNISDNQFVHAINAVIDNETIWPSISIIHKYASIWTESGGERKKVICPYCENTGFLLIKSQNRDIAYTCKCKEGQKKQKNFGIMAYESLGLPWPITEKPNFSKKMSKENKRLIDTFLGKIGEEMPDGEEVLWGMMVDGSLCESG